MCSAMDNPVTPGTGTEDPPEDALSVLYGDLPDAPTGSYMGSAGLPIATGETKVSISGWTEDLSASGYLNAEALNRNNLTLTVGMEDGEDFAIVPILTQVEYPANNSVSYITLPEDVTLLGYDFAPAADPAKLLEQTYTETSAAVSGIYVKSDQDFTALFTYVAGDGTKLEKTLNVEVRADADTIPTLYSTNSAATYSRPTPSVTSGKITSIQQVSGTWLIWFNGEDAYCCDNGKNGRPAGCPTYHYTHTSTVDATQYVPGDHYGNQMRIWGGLDQLSMGLLTVRESDDFSAEFCARNSSTYSASDAAVPNPPPVPPAAASPASPPRVKPTVRPQASGLQLKAVCAARPELMRSIRPTPLPMLPHSRRGRFWSGRPAFPMALMLLQAASRARQCSPTAA